MPSSSVRNHFGAHFAVSPTNSIIWSHHSSGDRIYLEGNTAKWTNESDMTLETEQQTATKGLRWRNMCFHEETSVKLTEKWRAKCNLGLQEQVHKPWQNLQPSVSFRPSGKRDFLNVGGKTTGIKTTPWIWPQNCETLFQLIYWQYSALT